MRPNHSGLSHQGFRGCAPRAPQRKRKVDVYRDCTPPIPHKNVGFLTNDGRVFEQHEIEEVFLRRAKEMGGDALVLHAPVKSMEAPTGWNLYDTFLFEAEVVSYR